MRSCTSAVPGRELVAGAAQRGRGHQGPEAHAEGDVTPLPRRSPRAAGDGEGRSSGSLVRTCDTHGHEARGTTRFEMGGRGPHSQRHPGTAHTPSHQGTGRPRGAQDEEESQDGAPHGCGVTGLRRVCGTPVEGNGTPRGPVSGSRARRVHHGGRDAHKSHQPAEAVLRSPPAEGKPPARALPACASTISGTRARRRSCSGTCTPSTSRNSWDTRRYP
jgi:hypothetical protein